ncbi:SET and MYND domain-containing protein 3 [Actinomortierella ambigua]|nr:SET and MYND domain-containing protein 3 [Actinomortierella ambigua]
MYFSSNRAPNFKRDRMGAPRNFNTTGCPTSIAHKTTSLDERMDNQSRIEYSLPGEAEGAADLHLHINLDSMLQTSYSATNHDASTSSARSGRTVKLSRVATKDRGMIMRTDVFLPRGTLLFRIEPLSGVPDADHQQSHCAKCLNKVEEATKVGCHGGCAQVVYCDSRCRDQDHLLLHHMECGFLAKWSMSEEPVSSRLVVSSAGPNERVTRVLHDTNLGVGHPISLSPYSWDYMRLILHILTLHFFLPLQHLHQTPQPQPHQQTHDLGNGSINKHAKEYSDIFNQAMDMVENRSSFSQECLENEFSRVVEALNAYQDWIFRHLPSSNHRRPKLSKDDMLALICKEECNSFGIYNYPLAPSSFHTASSHPQPFKRQGYGLGLYVDCQAHRFNHSCAPNLYRVFHGREMITYTGRDIQPGEELSIPYLELGGRAYRGEASLEEQRAEFQHRKKFLNDIFMFECRCVRCQAEDARYTNAYGMQGQSNGMTHYTQVGLTCAGKKDRECFGSYVPLDVQKVIGLDGGGDGLANEPWQCAACGQKIQEDDI